MRQIERRTVLKGAAATAGAAILGGPFHGFVARAAGAAKPPSPSLQPIPDLRDNQVRLHLPEGFQYRSFHDTEFTVTLTDGTVLPGRHDGMGAFPASDGNIWLVRNHEINNPGSTFGPGTPYDAMAQGGTTTSKVDQTGQVLESFTSLNGTQMNCSGGRMPWGSWITCEETINGPDVGPDFTGAPNIPLQQRHGFIYEVPAGGQSDRRPITSAGRFAHEAVAWSNGALYMTEDDFGFPSGLFRYVPATNPMTAGHLGNNGRLQMLKVVGQDNADLAATQPARASYRVEWVDIDDPAPTFPYTPGVVAPTPNDTAILHVANQGFAQGAAYFSRLEGCVADRNTIYFCSTQGGGPAETSFGPIADGFGNGSGQVWAYQTKTKILKLVYQSTGPDVLDFPDNVTTSKKGTLVLCEDNINDNYVRGLGQNGQLFNIALNRLVSQITGLPRFNDEFAGTTFSPNGQTLFVNIQASRGMTFAIWGPWSRIGV